MTPFLVVVAALVAIGLAGITVARLRRADFSKRFTPISDAEFLARCRPGTRPEVALKVRRIVANHLAVDYERVCPSMSFIEDLGVD